MKALRDIGPATLRSSEQAVMRNAADSLLFCGNIAQDPGARAAYSAFGALRARLVDAGRWTSERADALADDVWACGPGLDMPLRRAA